MLRTTFTTCCLRALLLTLFFVCAGVTGIAQQEHLYRVDLDVGYRWNAFFKGSEDLYRTQLDLGEGPKLFSANLLYSPPEEENSLFDRAQLKLDGWGGEPHNAATLNLGRDGAYDFRFYYRNFHHFSSIPNFANPLFSEGSLESQHRFDTSLRSTGFEMAIFPGKTVSPFIAYHRSSQEGLRRTTLAADGDDFVLDSQLDIKSDDLSGGVQMLISRLSLRLEQGIRWYHDETPFFSGSSAGNSDRNFFGRPIFLDQYTGQNNIDATIPYSNATAVFRAHETLTLRGNVSYSIADTRAQLLEMYSGNFFRLPPTSAFYGDADNQLSGDAKRPNLRLDLSGEWRPVSWFRLLERFNTHRFHTSGSTFNRMTFLNVDPLLDPLIGDRIDETSVAQTFLGLNFDRQELIGEVYLHPSFSVRAGHRFEHRELELDRALAWDRNVLLLGGTYSISARNRLSVEYEMGRTDRALFRLDPVDFDRLRIRGRFAPFENLEFSGSVTLFDHQNDIVSIDLDSENRGYSFQFTYTPVTRISVTGEYARTRHDADILYVVPQDFSIDRFSYRERGDYGSLFFTLLLLHNSKLDLGYSVWGNVGNFPVNYHQPYARLEVPFDERVAGYVQWNYYDYNEKFLFLPQDYRSHLVIFGLRLGFGNM